MIAEAIGRKSNYNKEKRLRQFKATEEHSLTLSLLGSLINQIKVPRK